MSQKDNLPKDIKKKYVVKRISTFKDEEKVKKFTKKISI